MVTKEFRKLQKKVWIYHRQFLDGFYKKLGNKCFKCGTDKDLQLHHDRYRLDKDISNLRLFCRKHHSEFHRLYRKRLKKEEEIRSYELKFQDMIDSLKNKRLNIEESNKNFFSKLSGVSKNNIVTIEAKNVKNKNYRRRRKRDKYAKDRRKETINRKSS